MTKKIFQSGILFFAVLLICLLVPIAGAFEVSPSSPTVGDEITVSGYTDKTGSIPANIVFTSVVPVNDGTYLYDAGKVNIPDGPNSFHVKAVGVDDLEVKVKIGIWLTPAHPQATNGVASYSMSGVPEGTYPIKLRGQAQSGEKSVDITITASSSIAVEDGYYEYSYSTSSIPAGDFTLTIDGESKTINLAGASTSSGSSGGSSGGGSIGISPDIAANNVVASEHTNSRAVSGMPVEFNFKEPLNPVTYIGFTSGITSSDVPVTIEILEHTSASVSKPPEGIVYRNINIWMGYTGFSRTENIIDASLKFKVDSSWIEDNNLDPEELVFMHYDETNNVWEPVSTELIEVLDGYAYYQSSPECFSPFAIVGTEELLQQVVEGLPSEDDVNENNTSVDDVANSVINEPKNPNFGKSLLFILVASMLGMVLFFKLRK